MPPPDLIRIKEIFTEALEFPPAERAAFLDRSCAGNPDLRAEVEAFLAAAETPDALLESNRPRFNYLPEYPGTLIGRYKLLEQIGEGGFGVVFMAEQESPVRRNVALKIIKLGMDTRQVIARFEAERQALALMDHPNIAKVFDAGATDAGRPYFVMELVKGDAITRYCDKRNLTIPQRLQLFAQVCLAVQHAHQKGLIHRDIKPSNVLVVTQDDKPVAKVIDFGIAKAMQDRLTDKTLFTEFHQLLGTPEYMSPEQTDGGLDMDTRSDIYSLGVLLYELLTGSPPFDPKELRSLAFAEMQRTIREVEPPVPSTRVTDPATQSIIATLRSVEPRKLASLIRGELDWIVMRCLEKDRNLRYQTAGDLAQELDRFLNDQPVQAQPPTPLYRARKFIHRNKVAVSAAAGVAAALIVGLTLASIGLIQARREARRADHEAQNARIQAARSDQVSRFLTEMLNGVGPGVALGRDTALLRDILNKTAARLATDLKGQPEVEIELRLTLCQIYHELGLYEQMESMARQALALARATFGEESTAVADSLGQLGDALSHVHNIPEAEPTLRQAIAMERKVRGPQSLQLANALYHLSHAITNRGNVIEIEAASREALAIQRALLGNQHQDIARTLDELGSLLSRLNRLPESEKLLRESLAMRINLFGSDSPELIRSYSLLSTTLIIEHKFSEAEAMLRQGIAVNRKTPGGPTFSITSIHSDLSNLLVRQAKFTEAESVLRDLIVIQNTSVLNNQTITSDSYSGIVLLIDLLSGENKLADAEAICRQTFTVAKQNKNASPAFTANYLILLVSVMCWENKAADAQLLLRDEMPLLLQATMDNPTNKNNLSTLGLLAWEFAQMFEDTTLPAETAKLRPILKEPLAQLLNNLAAADPNADPDQLVYVYSGAFSLYLAEGNKEKTDEFARKLLTIKPKYGALYVTTAQLLTHGNTAHHDFPLAVEFLKKALEANPYASGWWSDLGGAQFRANNYEQAIVSYEKAIQIANGGVPFQFFNLAICHQRLNHPEQAKHYYDLALDSMNQLPGPPAYLVKLKSDTAHILNLPQPATIPTSQP